MNIDAERNKTKYKLTYTLDKELKGVLKFHDNKTLGGSFTMKRNYLEGKWKIFGEVCTDGKRELEVGWKKQLFDRSLRLDITNKIRFDRDYDHTMDLKLVYQKKFGDVSSFVSDQ